jgi:CRISPR-associated protein Csm2
MAYTKPLETKWVTERIDNTLNGWADEFGKYLTQSDKPLTTTQLRRFFGEIKRIGLSFKDNASDVYMLEPKLAYAVGRVTGTNKGRIKEFYEELSRGLREVTKAIDKDEAKETKDEEYKDSHRQFKNFTKVAEAIVAYHKSHGGKDN